MPQNSANELTQYVLIAGGSRGLGLAMGIELAQKGPFREHSGDDGFFANPSGAHIILAARGRETLEEAKKVVLSHRKADTKVDIISIDLCDAKAVRVIFDLNNLFSVSYFADSVMT